MKLQNYQKGLKMTNKKFKEILINEINFQLEKCNIEKVKQLDILLMLYCKKFSDYKKHCDNIKYKNQFLDYIN